MEEKKYPMLIPQYMEQFSCIGSKCEDSCCIGWIVTVDENTYKKYKRIHDVSLHPIIKENLKRNRSGVTNDNYAKIKMDNKEACPFLSDDMLCNIQLKLGEEYLSNTCGTYPRITNLVNGILERSGTLSCPEISRLALLNPNGIEFVEVEEILDERTSIVKLLDVKNPLYSNKVERYFWELRIFTIQVMKNRNFKLWERMIVVGMFYRKLQEYLDSNNLTKIPELINSYLMGLKDDSLRESLNQIPIQFAIQLQLVKEIIDLSFLISSSNQNYLDCLHQTIKGIGYIESDTIENNSLRYKNTYENAYLPFINNYEYILENYLVNYVFKNLFPIARDSSMFDEFVLMTIHYSIIKLHFIGMAGFYKLDFRVEQAIQIIQSFSKTVEHNSSFLREIMKLIKLNGYNILPYMAILLKN